MKVCIIGAGAAGLTAAYKLAAKGFEVTVLEKEKYTGGLASTLQAGTTQLERYYHHIFTNDTEIQLLLEELGLSGLLKWATPANGIYTEGRLRPFTSPLDLLRFNVMPLAARIRTGLLVLKARSVSNWKDFENINAKDWLVKNAGAASYEKLWGPLLKSKFGSDAENVSAVWIWNKFKLRGSSRGKNINSEMLGYVTGSFGVIYETLSEKIIQAGGKIFYNEEVMRLTPLEDDGFEVAAANRTGKYDLVFSTISPSLLAGIAQGLPENYRKQLNDIRYKADVCVMLELESRLSPYYWITVAEKDSSFVIIAEHTNLFPDNRYGSHIVYLSRYLDVKDELYNKPDDEIVEIFTDTLAKMFPAWDKTSIKASHVSRAEYAQPVVTLGYSQVKPQYASPLKNLYTASMAHIYPEDRGQNYAIRSGLGAAELILENIKSAAT